MPVAILHAPSPLGLKPQLEGRVSGVARAPEALREAGLHERLGATFAGTVEPPPYIADRDAVTGLRNTRGIAQHSLELADALSPLLDGEAFPLVLGGDCSILLGAALALRRRGRYGLVYVDAHPDYLTVEQTETGGVAGLPLALVTGLGPDTLTSMEHRRPYIDAHDAVSVASRDPYQISFSSPDGAHVDGSPIRAYPLEAIRRQSPAAVAADVMARMVARGVDGVWIHFDVDALDSGLMPAVDSPEPDGLSIDEAAELLVPLVSHPLVRGLQVTIYDPDRDPAGAAARTLVDLLVAVLGRRG